MTLDGSSTENELRRENLNLALIANLIAWFATCHKMISP